LVVGIWKLRRQALSAPSWIQTTHQALEKLDQQPFFGKESLTKETRIF
jgi:hypothetical protein